MSALRAFAAAVLLAAAALPAHADAAERLRAFVRDVASGRADFTQTVSSEGSGAARPKVSSGRFEFQRPDRFRFEYLKPYPQLIVADGRKVWVHDPDLNQVTVRALGSALGATPAALLAGGSIDADFTLADAPSHDGLDWVVATPRQRDGTLQALRVGLRGALPAVVEITDAFGQRSRLQFSGFEANAAIAPERFRFAPPAGADVIEQ